MIGGYLGLLALVIVNTQLSLKARSIATGFFVIFCILGLRSMEKHLIDELNLRQSFPVIAGFETQLEISRWQYKLVNIKRVKAHSYKGDYSLKVDYFPGRYPNISLDHMKGNWSDYSKLQFAVYNPNPNKLEFELKIYDHKHIENNRRYNDRFNKSISFKPGWNLIEIPLNEVISAPKHRRMNINKIKTLSLFTDKLQKPTTLYIDDISLL